MNARQIASAWRKRHAVTVLRLLRDNEKCSQSLLIYECMRVATTADGVKRTMSGASLDQVISELRNQGHFIYRESRKKKIAYELIWKDILK